MCFETLHSSANLTQPTSTPLRLPLWPRLASCLESFVVKTGAGTKSYEDILYNHRVLTKRVSKEFDLCLCLTTTTPMLPPQKGINMN